MSGSCISWDICKSAPRSRQITTPAPHYSSFLQAGCPSCRPTNSIKAVKAIQFTHTRLTALFPGLPEWASTRKVKTNLDFTEARASEWQWHQLGICKSAPRSRQNNHANTSPLSFLQAGCPSCRPTNSVKALKAFVNETTTHKKYPALCAVYSEKAFVTKVTKICG